MIHVIPVPVGMSVVEAFDEIRLLRQLDLEHQVGDAKWAVVRVEDDSVVEVL